MPRGPKGERRPADVIGNAVHVMRIATGEVEDVKNDPAKEHMRRGGLAGGKARAQKLSKAKRTAIAKKAARARWAR
ncbi:MAG TPA: RNA-binding protein [Candidatus Binatia bacterium]|nr:RNA-binding protein [Candidatus Binatia bacterium]